MSLKDVYIVSAARTPIGNFNGAFSKVPASDLGAVVIKEVLKRANGLEPKFVNEVIFGQTFTAGQGQNPIRQAAIKAGLQIDTPAYGLNMLCGSGLKSVALGYQSIRCGDSTIVVCGGQENMTLTTHVMNLRQGIRTGNGTMIDTMLHDGLTDATHNIHMGVTAENVAKKYNISRIEQDEFATRSQNLAEIAQTKGYFEKEIVSVEIPDRKGNIIVSNDEFPKPGITVADLAKLRSCFIKDGTVTPGNASGLNDSASAVLLMSSEEATKHSLKPLAKIVGWAQSGCPPELMGIGPIGAVESLLKKVGWKKDEVDLFELNEAFAAQAVAVNRTLGLNQDKVNINGGAIALGHPLGASGNRILVTLLYALLRTGGKKGIASLCIGGGMGIAMAIEIV